MAQQEGIIPLNGTLGNITFYKGKTGFLARTRGGVTKSRIANDPAFQRTRENGSEFGRAGKAGRLLRTSLRALVQSASDGRMVGRLTKEMMKVIKADATSLRGERNVIDGEAEMLRGFEFNASGLLGGTFYAPFTPSIDRVSGILTVSVDSFVPANMIAAPAGATHYNLVAGASCIDFTNESYIAKTAENAVAPLDATPTAAILLSCDLAASDSTVPLFLVFGIRFYQEVNGNKYILKNNAYNALSIVDVSGF